MAPDLRSRRLERISSEVIAVLRAKGSIGALALRSHLSEWSAKDLRLALARMRRARLIDQRNAGRAGVYVLVA